MKKTILTILITLIAVTCAAAQVGENASLRVGEQKTVAGRLNVRFVEITSDSRCPLGTTCVWAGNAAVKIAVSVGRRRAEEFTLNSNVGAKSVEYGGYEISFVSLTGKVAKGGKLAKQIPVPQGQDELAISVKKITH